MASADVPSQDSAQSLTPSPTPAPAEGKKGSRQHKPLCAGSPEVLGFAMSPREGGRGPNDWHGA